MAGIKTGPASAAGIAGFIAGFAAAVLDAPALDLAVAFFPRRTGALLTGFGAANRFHVEPRSADVKTPAFVPRYMVFGSVLL
jgi:hypothetical protein